MAFEQRIGEGGLFQNKERASEKSPTHSGYIIADRLYRPGDRIEFSGWRRESNESVWVKLLAKKEEQGRDARPDARNDRFRQDSREPF